MKPPPKFLCDHMLQRMGKWLRAAGLDTKIILEPFSDQEVLDLALIENRLLITRDRHFLNMQKAAPILIYLQSNDFANCMREMNQKMAIDWLYSPFSRCLICNSVLDRVTIQDVKEIIPPQIWEQKKQFWFCPHCQHVFWNGSHTEHMLRQLEQWQQENTQAH